MDKVYRAFEDMKDPAKVKSIQTTLKYGIVQRMDRPKSSVFYTNEQIKKIVDAWVLVQQAIADGLPNEIYEMFVKTLDPIMAIMNFDAQSVWLAHEGKGVAEDSVRRHCERIIYKIDALPDDPQELYAKSMAAIDITKIGKD